MNVYDAIMKAAEHVERYPETFRFSAWRVPSDCGSPGCALGWIGYFSGTTRRAYDWVSTEVLGLGRRATSDFVFYRRMENLCSDWRNSARDCARALRLYAAKYHAPAIPKRTDAELVSALMARVTSGERIPEDA